MNDVDDPNEQVREKVNLDTFIKIRSDEAFPCVIFVWPHPDTGIIYVSIEVELLGSSTAADVKVS
jgi:hypothetical protein